MCACLMEVSKLYPKYEKCSIKEWVRKCVCAYEWGVWMCISECECDDICICGYLKTLAALRRDIFSILFHLLAKFINIFVTKNSSVLTNKVPNYRNLQNLKISISFVVSHFWNFVTAWQDDFAFLRLITFFVKNYLK